MIVQREQGFFVVSEHFDKKGNRKNLGGPYKTREEARKRLQTVEYFKNNKK
jgi:hypothetical protein